MNFHFQHQHSITILLLLFLNVLFPSLLCLNLNIYFHNEVALCCVLKTKQEMYAMPMQYSYIISSYWTGAICMPAHARAHTHTQSVNTSTHAELTHFAPDCPSPPALFPYCATPDCLVTIGPILASQLTQTGMGFSRDSSLLLCTTSGNIFCSKFSGVWETLWIFKVARWTHDRCMKTKNKLLLAMASELHHLRFELQFLLRYLPWPP